MSEYGDEPAVPGLAPFPARAEGEFELEVDGETFTVWTNENGGTNYDWSSGPNAGYGFGSGRAFDSPRDQHVEGVRIFLSMIDPETGYIGDE